MIWRRQRNAGIAVRGQLGMQRAHAGALLEISAMIGERHVLVTLRAFQNVAAYRIGIALAHGANEPAGLPAIAAVRQLHRVDQIGFQRGDFVVVMPRADFNAGGFQPHDIFAEPLLGADRSGIPARGLEHGDAPRLLAGRHAVRTLQPGRAGIAADPRNDFARDLPGILQGSSQDSGATLALIVVAAFAIDGVDARLETDAAAETRRSKDRANDLRAEGGADRAHGNGSRRAARRAAWRMRRVP